MSGIQTNYYERDRKMTYDENQLKCSKIDIGVRTARGGH